MKLIKIAGACAVLAIAASTAFASACYADAPNLEGETLLASSLAVPFPASATPAAGSVSPLLAKEIAVLTSQGISPARAVQALDVQGKVAQADLVSKVEAATGSGFGGVWFEPATAQLHIGVTSPGSGLTAEGVAARAGLAANVTVTPVRSAWAQLLATQKRWNRKLAGLFARAQVETGLEPQRNAVIVTLSSSVPARERATLEREASTAAVNVFVTVVPSAQIGGTQQANTTECNEWARSKAYCNPSITSGVTLSLWNPNTKKSEPECTAGPLAIPVANKKERVLLTAGHCIEKAGQKWEAFNKAAKNSVIGGAIEFSNGAPVGTEIEGVKATECFGKCDGGDYADIAIEPAWQTGNANDPAFAVTAEWKPRGPGGASSYPVTGERPPTAKNTSCHEGQTSGQSCGTIEQVEQTVPFSAEVPVCVKVANQKGARFYKTKAGCQKFKEGGEGEWEMKITCAKVANNNGPQYFETQEKCERLEQPPEEGEWKLTKLETEIQVVVVEGLVRVEGPRPELIGEGGDSGGPELFINGKNEATMEGTFTGGGIRCVNKGKVEKGEAFFKTEAECGNLGVKEKPENEGEWERRQRAFYYPLGKTLAKLKLELLTTANELIQSCL
jgi:hypothetical protein